MDSILLPDVVEYCLIPYLPLEDIGINFNNYLSYEVERRTIEGTSEPFHYAQSIGDRNLMQIAFDSWEIDTTDNMYKYCLDENLPDLLAVVLDEIEKGNILPPAYESRRIDAPYTDYFAYDYLFILMKDQRRYWSEPFMKSRSKLWYKYLPVANQGTYYSLLNVMCPRDASLEDVYQNVITMKMFGIVILRANIAYILESRIFNMQVGGYYRRTGIEHYLKTDVLPDGSTMELRLRLEANKQLIETLLNLGKDCY